MKRLSTIALLLLSITLNAQLIDDYPKRTNLLSISYPDSINIVQTSKSILATLEANQFVIDKWDKDLNTITTKPKRASDVFSHTYTLHISIRDTAVYVRAYWSVTMAGMGMMQTQTTDSRVHKRFSGPLKTMWEGMFKVYSQIFDKYPGTAAYLEETE